MKVIFYFHATNHIRQRSTNTQKTKKSAFQNADFFVISHAINFYKCIATHHTLQ